MRERQTAVEGEDVVGHPRGRDRLKRPAEACRDIAVGADVQRQRHIARETSDDALVAASLEPSPVQPVRDRYARVSGPVRQRPIESRREQLEIQPIDALLLGPSPRDPDLPFGFAVVRTRPPIDRYAHGGVARLTAPERLVLCAVALFFAGISTKLTSPALRLITLLVGCAVFLGAAIWVSTFPVSVSV